MSQLNAKQEQLLSLPLYTESYPPLGPGAGSPSRKNNFMAGFMKSIIGGKQVVQAAIDVMGSIPPVWNFQPTSFVLHKPVNNNTSPLLTFRGYIGKLYIRGDHDFGELTHRLCYVVYEHGDNERGAGLYYLGSEGRATVSKIAKLRRITTLQPSGVTEFIHFRDDVTPLKNLRHRTKLMLGAGFSQGSGLTTVSPDRLKVMLEGKALKAFDELFEDIDVSDKTEVFLGVHIRPESNPIFEVLIVPDFTDPASPHIVKRWVTSSTMHVHIPADGSSMTFYSAK